MTATTRPSAASKQPHPPKPPKLTLTTAALALIVLLLADAVAVTMLPRPVSLKAPGELAEVMPELQRFVEKTRGKRFRKQVSIRRSDNLDTPTTGLDATALGADPTALGAEPDPQQQQKERDAALDRAAVLFALGLVDKKYDPFAARRAINNSVLGIYRPNTHELVVRTGPITPRMRMTVVHELTHALDGEHHELRLSGRSDRLLPDESGPSVRALAEGTAVHVEAEYLKAMSPEDRATVEAASQGAPPSDVPEALRVLTSYPYTAGHAFVKKLIEQGGMDAVDKAFERPPTTSEHVLNVAKYHADDQPKTVPKPVPPDGVKVVQRGPFGELLLRLVASRASNVDTAVAVGTGWGGGRYIGWRNAAGTELCIRGHLVMDTPADTEEALAVLRQWANGKPRAQVTSGDYIVFENCVER